MNHWIVHTPEPFFHRGRGLSSLLVAVLLCAPVAGEQGEIDFNRDVGPALSKAGCNAGKCHGSFQGRGGFRLSLFGFDPHYDYDALVKQARGRRVQPAAPPQSLILRKPTGHLGHGGGQVITADSEVYQVLHDWISQGLDAPEEDDPRVVSIEPTPSQLQLRRGSRQQLRVQAHWSDGSQSDATAWALFESRKSDVAEVDEAGIVDAKSPGRTPVTIRYLGQVASVGVTVPRSDPAEEDLFAGLPRHNFIDDFIIEGWQKLGVEPAPLAADAEFLRRVYLDLIGTLPTPGEVREFLADTSTDKRNRIIDELLKRPEYVDYWSLRWGDLLRVHRRYLGDKGLENYRGWLRSNLRENRPADVVVRELLTAKGNLYSNGPVAFYFTDSSPENFTETTAQVFLGVRIHCAKCHHHPYETWSQEDYYGLAAFFTRFEIKENGDGGRFGGAKMLRPTDKPNRKMRPAMRVEPALLGTPLPEQAPDADIRVALADWITDPNNRYFARNLVNRYWAHMMGRGLVEPVDDLRDTNPPSHPELIDALADHFVQSGYDLKGLLRTIARSRTYQLASELNPQRDVDGTFYTHHRLRRMPAEVLLDAVNRAAGVEESFQGLPGGTRAIALPDPSVRSYFLTIFGRPKRNDPCECARVNTPDLTQALHLANSADLQSKVSADGGRVARLMQSEDPPADTIDALYLATFSRPPREEEVARAVELVGQAPSPQEGYEDLLWALLNSSEFLLNH